MPDLMVDIDEKLSRWRIKSSVGAMDSELSAIIYLITLNSTLELNHLLTDCAARTGPIHRQRQLSTLRGYVSTCLNV